MNVPKGFRPKKDSGKTTELLNLKYCKTKIFPKNLSKLLDIFMKTEISGNKLEDLAETIPNYISIDKPSAFPIIDGYCEWFAKLDFHIKKGKVSIYLPWKNIPSKNSNTIEVYATGTMRMKEVEDIIEEIGQALSTSEYYKEE